MEGAQLPATRSGFVTAVAWVFIILASFGTLISVAQNVMVAFLFPADFFENAASHAAQDTRMPAVAVFMFQHMRLMFAAFLVVSAGMLAAAIGLLARRNWARVLFIALLGLGMLWNVAGLAAAVAFVSSVPAADAGSEGFRTMMRVIMGFNILLVVGLTVVCGWIVKRLLSADVRREFLPGGDRA